MQAIWNSISSIATSDLAFTGGGRTRALTIVRRADVRAVKLSIDPRDASVRLVMPQRAPLRAALACPHERRAWIESELARLPVPCPIVPGMVLSLAGQSLVLDWSPDRPRTVRLSDGAIIVGGPREQLAGRVLRFARARALALLDGETREIAALAGVIVGRVGVGDPKGRWGSCSAAGDIRYSWRLILAPSHVRRATVAHEVAHRVHMNHSPAFYSLARDLGGIDPAVSRAWLRANGAALHWFGRDD